MIYQKEFNIGPLTRGFHLITETIVNNLPNLPQCGLINIFTPHTSCGLSINENFDPSVRRDLETIFNSIVPENSPYYTHTLEGSDDMPAHGKSILSGVSLSIPITGGHMNLGTWQGIYFNEYRKNGGQRKIIITIIGE